jgi:hypothetical protein
MDGGDEARDLERRMAQAAADQDFELAARLRDRLAALRGENLPAEESGSLFQRQVPGRMGLGSDQQVYRPPEGWTPPPKPDLMTANKKPRRGGR